MPNERGLARAEAAGVDAIAVFTAATDAFTQHNIGMTVAESLAAFAPILARAGASFDLKKYNDEVLAFGSPPVKYVRELMGL